MIAMIIPCGTIGIPGCGIENTLGGGAVGTGIVGA